jgi:Protein of unknown function (DUF1573)
MDSRTNPSRLEAAGLCASIVGVVLAAGTIAAQIHPWKSIQPSSAPIQVEPEVYDLGKVREGVYSKEFLLTNVSDAATQVVAVQKACGCEEVHVSDEPFDPSSSIQLSCKWDLRGKDGSTETNFTILTRSVTMPASAGERAESAILPVRVLLKAEVIPSWRLVPDTLSFSIAAGPVAQQTFHVKSMDDYPVSLISASSGHDAIKVSFDGAPNEVNVSFDRTKWLVPGPVEILIRTDCRVCPNKILPVSVLE